MRHNLLWCIVPVPDCTHIYFCKNIHTARNLTIVIIMGLSKALKLGDINECVRGMFVMPEYSVGAGAQDSEYIWKYKIYLSSADFCCIFAFKTMVYHNEFSLTLWIVNLK